MSTLRDGALVHALRDEGPVLSVELRPPRAELDARAGMDAWIDTYHAVHGLVRTRTFVFLTDSAVGANEEHNLRHLVINLGQDVPRDFVVPFLTAKHPLPFCLRYAERAWQEGFRSLVVLGGDRTIGPPRCVEHAWQLRQAVRAHVPDLALGGWANPHADPDAQVGHLADDRFTGEFFLTQVVSHHDERALEGFLGALDRSGLRTPGVFGVFFYRSANARTLSALRQFLPVPVEALRGSTCRICRPAARAQRRCHSRAAAPLVRGWRDGRGHLRAQHSEAPCARPAPGTSMCRICRPAARAQPSRASWTWPMSLAETRNRGDTERTFRHEGRAVRRADFRSAVPAGSKDPAYVPGHRRINTPCPTPRRTRTPRRAFAIAPCAPRSGAFRAAVSLDHRRTRWP